MDFDGKNPWVSGVHHWSKEVVTIGPAFEGHNKRLGEASC